jgi:hypothetical protein
MLAPMSTWRDLMVKVSIFTACTVCVYIFLRNLKDKTHYSPGQNFEKRQYGFVHNRRSQGY